MDTAAVGARIKERRKGLGLDQNKLAAAVGISRSMISLYEQGKSPISTPTLIKAAEFLNVPLSYLVGDIDYEEILLREEQARVAPMEHRRGALDHRVIESQERMKRRIMELLDKVPYQLHDVAVNVVKALTEPVYINNPY